MSASWSDLPQPLLQAILLAALPQTLHFPRLLLRNSPEFADAAAQQRLIAAVRGTCRAWAHAVAAADLRKTWAVAFQRPAAAASALHPQLEQLAVAALDLRRLTWSEAGGSAVAEALLASAAFRHRSASVLHTAVGIPERLCGVLAAGFPGLQTVGLCEDYGSTERKAHSAPMQVGAAAARRARVEEGLTPALFTPTLPLPRPPWLPAAGASARPGASAPPAAGAGSG